MRYLFTFVFLAVLALFAATHANAAGAVPGSTIPQASIAAWLRVDQFWDTNGNGVYDKGIDHSARDDHFTLIHHQSGGDVTSAYTAQSYPIAVPLAAGDWTVLCGAARLDIAVAAIAQGAPPASLYWAAPIWNTPLPAPDKLLYLPLVRR